MAATLSTPSPSSRRLRTPQASRAARSRATASACPCTRNPAAQNRIENGDEIETHQHCSAARASRCRWRRGGAGGKVIAILPAQAWKGCCEQGRWLWCGREGDLRRSDHGQAADWLWPAPRCFDRRRAVCRKLPCRRAPLSAPAGGRASDVLQSQRLRSTRKRARRMGSDGRGERRARGEAPVEMARK